MYGCLKRYQIILHLSLLTVLSLTFCSCSMTSIVSDYLRTVVIVPQRLSEFRLPLVTLQSIDLYKKNLKVKSHKELKSYKSQYQNLAERMIISSKCSLVIRVRRGENTMPPSENKRSYGRTCWQSTVEFYVKLFKTWIFRQG